MMDDDHTEILAKIEANRLAIDILGNLVRSVGDEQAAQKHAIKEWRKEFEPFIQLLGEMHTAFRFGRFIRSFVGWVVLFFAGIAMIWIAVEGSIP